MKAPAALPAKRGARPRQEQSQEDLKALFVPIMKRLPRYLRLGWALLRDPEIERRHKLFLYSAIVYAVTPVNLMTSAVPVVGQIDTFVLLLLGLRHTLIHCPPEVAARHLARLKLAPKQLSRDMYVLLYIGWSAVGNIGRKVRRPVGSNLRFAGRVATGFSRRMVGRLIGTGKPSTQS